MMTEILPGQMSSPAFSRDESAASAMIKEIVRQLYDQNLGNREGEVADYIPELGKVSPDQFGIAVALESGELITAGDATNEFTIQSISKALTLAILLDLVGRGETYRAVGVQPSGDPFNSITLDPRTNRPFNPMVNAGAIAIAGRLYETLGPSAFEQVLARMSAAAGRELRVDQTVFESERETGHRNRAIGHLLRAAEVFTVPVDDVLELYFRQCSVLVTATDLAIMGATLGNIGTNPITGKDVFGIQTVRETLSVMFTCGMYDGAGDWACQVGLPAKSGVGGGIMAVVNRQLGVGVLSPRLDAAGNSVRGKQCCIGLAEALGLHAFDSTNSGSNFLRGMTEFDQV
jgi:glutaminase